MQTVLKRYADISTLKKNLFSFIYSTNRIIMSSFLCHHTRRNFHSDQSKRAYIPALPVLGIEYDSGTDCDSGDESETRNANKICRLSNEFCELQALLARVDRLRESTRKMRSQMQEVRADMRNIESKVDKATKTTKKVTKEVRETNDKEIQAEVKIPVDLDASVERILDKYIQKGDSSFNDMNTTNLDKEDTINVTAELEKMANSPFLTRTSSRSTPRLHTNAKVNTDVRTYVLVNITKSPLLIRKTLCSRQLTHTEEENVDPDINAGLNMISNSPLFTNDRIHSTPKLHTNVEKVTSNVICEQENIERLPVLTKDNIHSTPKLRTNIEKVASNDIYEQENFTRLPVPMKDNIHSTPKLRTKGDKVTSHVISKLCNAAKSQDPTNDKIITTPTLHPSGDKAKSSELFDVELSPFITKTKNQSKPKLHTKQDTVFPKKKTKIQKIKQLFTPTMVTEPQKQSWFILDCIFDMHYYDPM